MGEVRLHCAVVDTKWLYWLGYVIGLGTPPSHCKIYWEFNGKKWMTELTSDPGTAERIVGKGDGYTIQITPVDQLEGVVLPDADASLIEGLARAYASTEKGDLTALPYDREWYLTPQGYGGPTYDRSTSNTYASWILRKVCKTMPAKPSGTLGWEHNPLFPGPHKCY